MRKTTTVVRVANPQKNPVLAAISGLTGANPQGGTMKKTTKKKNSAPVKKASKKNPKPAAYVMKPTAKPKKNPKRNGARNPELFGMRMSTSDIVIYLLAGLGGVAITKFVTPQLPQSVIETTAGRFLASGAVAVAAGMAASKVSPKIGPAVAFGGGMQAMSVGLNAYLPSVGSRLSLAGVGRRRPGMGMLVDVPWVPVMNPFAGTPSAGAAAQLPPAPPASAFTDPATEGPYRTAY